MSLLQYSQHLVLRLEHSYLLNNWANKQMNEWNTFSSQFPCPLFVRGHSTSYWLLTKLMIIQNLGNISCALLHSDYWYNWSFILFQGFPALRWYSCCFHSRFEEEKAQLKTDPKSQRTRSASMSVSYVLTDPRDEWVTCSLEHQPWPCSLSSAEHLVLAPIL